MAAPVASQLLDTTQAAALRRAASELVPRVEAGGHTAKKALAKAIAMMSEPSAKNSIKGSGLKVRVCISVFFMSMWVWLR